VPDTTVTNNEAEQRFETTVEGHRAELTYRTDGGNRLVLVHTEVPNALEGRGIGGDLVTAAVDHAADHGLTLVPHCPFARGWLERHVDVADRVAIDVVDPT
jgi:predicted GNAT family acetyltransferase